MNSFWDLKKAIDWIEMSVTAFKDISTQDGEALTFIVYSPKGGR